MMNRAKHLAGWRPDCCGLELVVDLARRIGARAKEKSKPERETHRSNEKEISHGRVWWQTHWTCNEMGPLASSTG